MGIEQRARNRPYRIVTSAGTSGRAADCIWMRLLIAILLVLVRTASFAAGSGETRTAEGIPTATEVIAGLFAFSRFQEGALESTDLKGNADVQKVAALRAEEAVKRDRALKEIQSRIGAEVRLGKPPASASLAEPDSSDGPAYIRAFHAAQVAEYASTISMLERYLKGPDNAALSAFARDQLPTLRSQMTDSERSMADR